MLRGLLFLFGIALILFGVLGVPVLPFAIPRGTAFVVGGLFVVLAVLFEARRYRRAGNATGGGWEPTGERFVDPSSGKRMSVRYNPQTGERDYVED